MKIIKLNAIDSTNSFLKDLAKKTTLENFTTVSADAQEKGRGQMDTQWVSDPFKNLTFSTLINSLHLKINEARYINFAISLAILDILKNYNLENIKIKWPNDILSDQQKICGILVENTFTGNVIKNTILGIGLNVNQINFYTLKNVTSIKREIGKELNLETLLKEILQCLKMRFDFILSKKFNELEQDYLSNLYRFEEISDFKTTDNRFFSGKIVGIARNGNLKILDNNNLREFAIKEISFL